MDKIHDWITTGERPLPFFVSPFAKGASGGKSRDDDEGDEDSDDDDDDDDEDDEEEDDDDDDEFADLSEAEIRAELKKATERLTKAGGSVKSKRARIRKLKRELEDARKPKPAGKSKGDDDEAPDLDAIREAAKAEAKTEADNRIKRSEAKAALVAAGVSREQAADLVGFVKLDDLDFDDDGEVEGLDDEIERIQKKYPTFFAKTTGRRRRESVAGGADRGGEGARPKKPLTASQRQAALVTGGGR